MSCILKVGDKVVLARVPVQHPVGVDENMVLNQGKLGTITEIGQTVSTYGNFTSVKVDFDSFYWYGDDMFDLVDNTPKEITLGDRTVVVSTATARMIEHDLKGD